MIRRFSNANSIPIKAYKSNRNAQLQGIDKFPNYQRPNLCGENIAVPGRIKRIRTAGSKLVFIDLQNQFKSTQIILNAKHIPLEDLNKLKSVMEVGDNYEFIGWKGKSKTGQDSIFAVSGRLLSPCMRQIPLQLKDVSIQHRQPYLNMLVNEENVNLLRIRSKVLWKLREILYNKGFEEVETPILSSKAGGAVAKPFTTQMLATNQTCVLRIAPELYLKKLVVGGYDKVFEIGKQFRNEGIDATHNPEFTTCELYETYTSLDEMMDFTEQVLQQLVFECRKSTEIIHDDVTIDFSTKFARIDIVTELERLLGSLPDLNNAESLPELINLAQAHGISVSKPTLSRVVDKLIGELIEKKCIQPTFLIGHPICLSPLAKRDFRGYTRRFELFVGGTELINSYEELNDPQEQLERFQSQGTVDEDFITALEYGLPPTTGWGLGIDRLCMLIGNTPRIRDVITFPV